MRYGLPVDEFYRMNPKQIERYQPFLLEKIKYDRDEMSQRGWIDGQYVAKAISINFSKKAKYPDSPIQFYRPTEEIEEEEYRVTDADKFWAGAMVFNASHPALKQLPAPEDTE